MKLHRVIVFCPTQYSLYSISTLELLKRNNIHVAGVVVRKMFTPNRVISELRRDGWRLFHKIYRKLILKSSAFSNDSVLTLPQWMREERIIEKSTKDWAKKNKVPYFTCKAFHDSKILHFLNSVRIDCIIFTGGGLIRQETLSLSGKGVINCHSGFLPYYRGMDVVEWAILDNRKDQIGLTSHLMDRGIDTGAILQNQFLSINKLSSLQAIRNSLECMMPKFIVESCLGFLDGKLKPQAQDKHVGKQHFIMHAHLLKQVRKKLKTEAV